MVDDAVKALVTLQRVNGSLSEQQQAHWNHTLGEKETICSVTAKISACVNKLLAMDAHLHGFTREDLKRILPMAT